MRTYFGLVTLRGFDELRRRIGYTRAGDVLDELRAEIAALLPAETKARTSRASVDFVFQADSAESAAAQLRLLVAAIQGEIPIRGRRWPRCAIAAAAPCRRGNVSEQVLAEAEAALRRADTQADPVAIAEERAGEPDDQRLMQALAAALKSDQLELHYQPKLNARTGLIAGCEALLRWEHPELGRVPPDLFVAVAERRGEIGALTDWTLDRAIAGAGRLRSIGLDVPIHVNISAQLVARPDFIQATIERLGGHQAAIGLELTETCMIADPEGALAGMQRLAEAGIRLAIDDYGSGFSSLAYLQRLPMHELKIDRLFISRLTSGARDPLLVRSTIDLAHALEMEVTAEGVGSAAALALLQVMRCDMVQGFFLSPALPLDELIAYAGRAAAQSMLPAPGELRPGLRQRRERRAA